ncbi:MAG TPA: fumarylacetoacetate hydrolase family protein [Bdellovibrionota bacterium]|jgi:fumarylacetoacetate (FAA) hydrolase|nr:fumarylacetoacetate hydrolase family protein [Bdellovibrionota bacterium]
MRLATLKNGTRDGELVVVNRDHTKAVRAAGVARHLQDALDRWAETAPKLKALSERLEDGRADGVFSLDSIRLHAPLPRAYAWIDGSAYINHIVLVRKARGAQPPATLETDPLVYQGGSDAFLGPNEDIPLEDEAWGCDFESEVAVITDDVPMGVSVADAAKHIQLLMICNDVSLRNLIPAELEKGFGFFQSKPSSAFGPLAVTPDELGDAWKNGRVHLPLVTHLNGAKFGDPDAGPEMHFSFPQLIAHAAKTRPLAAGTIIGSGTVSNRDRARGSSCLAEKRMIEKIDTGSITTPFLKHGDTVTIEMFDPRGRSIFGRIHQKVVPYTP